MKSVAMMGVSIRDRPSSVPVDDFNIVSSGSHQRDHQFNNQDHKPLRDL